MFERFRRKSRRFEDELDAGLGAAGGSPYQIVWAILAGGSGFRFGGDHARLEVKGVPMVEWVAGAMRNAGGDPLIIGRTASVAGIAAVPDIEAGCGGHLRGAITAMDAAENAARVGEGPAVAVVSAVSLPLVRPATLRFLAALADERRAVIPVVDGEPFGLLGVYPARLLREALFSCKRGADLDEFLKTAPIRLVPEEEWRAWGEDGSSFFVVRTREDLVEAESRL